MSTLLIDDSSIRNGDTLKKLSAAWHKRAVVNQPRVNYFEMPFDKEKYDFCESLLPFSQHPAWLNAPKDKKSACLSYAWILYNMKTVYIECNIVTPACEDLLKLPCTSSNQSLIQQVVAEALLDEALHTKMSIDACNYIYEKRGLKHLGELHFNLVGWRDAQLACCGTERQAYLTKFAIACASETLITDYLDTLSNDETIQPICYAVTKAHAIDEWSHSSVFSTIASDLVISMSEKERKYFSSIITKTIDMFADTELGVWQKVFEILNFPNYQEIIQDSLLLTNVEVYLESVNVLLKRIGLGESYA